MIYIVLGVIVLIVIVIMVMLTYRKLRLIKNLEVKIEKVEKKIEYSLNSKIPYYQTINDELSKENQLCDDLGNINNFVSLIELDEKENEFDKNIQNYIDSKKKFKPNDEAKVALEELYNENINCTAYKKYYNELTTTYNAISNKFIIRLLRRTNMKKLFNESVDEKFEILKKK